MALRRGLWKDLEDLCTQIPGPRAVMGDFNSVLNREERVGSHVTLAEMRDFRQCMEACCFQELRSTRAFYTWNNKQSGEDRVMSIG